MNKRNRLWSATILLAIMLAITSPFASGTLAQAGDIVWSEPINLSNSPALTSTDPFLLPDPSGGAHLFWAERAATGVAQSPDTLMYSFWDGENWSRPIDIFFSPISDGNPVVGYPHAVLDKDSRIHLFWLSEPNFPYYAVNYSSVEASKARFVSAWKPKVVLADNLIGTKYSFHIAYAPDNTLHLIYASGTQSDRPNEDRTVKYMQSTDLGQTWSAPVDLFTSPVLLWGASDTRMVFVPPSTLYASWTLWDDTGNGYQIYFTRSQDNGATWSTPIVLAQNREDEYERDWNSLVPLGKDQVMAMWEGGWRAYRQAQYSYDGGVTWSDPIDTFPRLIGDNGYVEFVQDSAGTWHAFLAQRLREGNFSFTDDNDVSLWHSTWLGGAAWSDPVRAITGDSTRAMTNPKVAIVNGNRIVAAWYGSQIYEIMVATGVIQDAPPIPPKPWPEPVVVATPQPIRIPATPLIVETPPPTPTPFIVKPIGQPASSVPTTATFNILFGVVSSLVISLVMIIMVVFRGRH